MQYPAVFRKWAKMGEFPSAAAYSGCAALRAGSSERGTTTGQRDRGPGRTHYRESAAAAQSPAPEVTPYGILRTPYVATYTCSIWQDTQPVGATAKWLNNRRSCGTALLKAASSRRTPNNRWQVHSHGPIWVTPPNLCAPCMGKRRQLTQTTSARVCVRRGKPGRAM